MKKQNVRTISLIVCTFTYLLVGAAVFDALESETEKKRAEALQAIENMLIKKYGIDNEDYKVMETVILKTEPHKAGQQWKFTGAFYYATTVLTTIGYGHSTPATIGGKLFTMFYAAVGIPLGLVMFQSIGERVNRLSSFIIQNVKKSLNCRKTQASELDLICVVTTLSSLTIAGGAFAFSRFENWSYFDSVYYCFITLTTIGFGDMVALQKDNALNKKPEYVMFALVFILFGLAIVAASLNLLVLRFVTMNTEDERRDEAQAMQALQVAVRLEGDVITSNGSILSGQMGHHIHINNNYNSQILHQTIQRQDSTSLDGDNTSICSCHCACFSATRERRKRFHVRGSPPILIKNILPPRQFDYPQKNRLKKFSSSVSLPPTTLFSLKDFSSSSTANKKIPAITDSMDSGSLETFNNNYNSNMKMFNNHTINDFDDDVVLNMNEDLYNFYNQSSKMMSHKTGDYYNIHDDIRTGEQSHDDDDDQQQMTTTTTIASLKCHQSQQQQKQEIMAITTTNVIPVRNLRSISPNLQHRASM